MVRLPICILAAAVLVTCGCRRDSVQFASNDLYAAVLADESGQPMDQAAEDVAAVVEAEFGTPDEPRWPESLEDDPRLASLVDLERLQRAAGPVSSDQAGVHVGLFREHCSDCHGVTGDGLGPAAALQTPYPRDYRPGIFKYKSTPRGVPPTRGDLLVTLQHGLPGTPMPKFDLLPEEDLEALVDYVVYLSIRGQVERRLLRMTAMELDYSPDSQDRWLVSGTRDANPERLVEQRQIVAAEVTTVAQAWADAPQRVPTVTVPDLAAMGEESLRIGRELFEGQVANCASCHGPNGRAPEHLPPDYDDWTKEWTTGLGIDPDDRSALEPFREAGGLRPRRLAPRNLTLGVYRGGDEAVDLYLRIVHGIDGTPMPAASVLGTDSEAGGVGLSEEEVWHLIHYVRTLGASGGGQ